MRLHEHRQASVTPDLTSTYGHLSHRVLEDLGIPSVSLAGDALRARFPYLEADAGYIDLDGGVVNLPAVTAALLRALDERGVRIVQGVTTRLAARRGSEIRVVTDLGEWASRSLVVTAGHGTNDVLGRLNGALLQVPLTRDRPIEAKYSRLGRVPRAVCLGCHAGHRLSRHRDLLPPDHRRADRQGEDRLLPPAGPPRATTTIDSVMSFVERCVPVLLDARIEPVDDVDGCDYDLVADDEFVLGAVPGFAGAYVGVGWRGTGYKFAPWVGRVLAELAVEGDTLYDVSRFDPARFTKGGSDAGPAVRANLQQRLAEDVILGAEGYVFELERRGYIKAGPYVPEVILDSTEAVIELHREFLRAGADVMVALTYYAHREKLKIVGREGDLEEMNRTAVRIANQVAREGGALVAANISNTWSYDPADARRTGAIVRAQYEEQLSWAADEGVDFVIAETNDYLGEALIGLEVCHELGLPVMVTFASVHPTCTYDGYTYVEACRRAADAAPPLSGSTARAGRRR